MNMMFKRGEAEKSSYLIPSGVFLFFKLEDNHFTILCWFLPYISMNQPQVYTCPLPSETPSHCIPPPEHWVEFPGSRSKFSLDVYI